MCYNITEHIYRTIQLLCVFRLKLLVNENKSVFCCLPTFRQSIFCEVTGIKPIKQLKKIIQPFVHAVLKKIKSMLHEPRINNTCCALQFTGDQCPCTRHRQESKYRFKLDKELTLTAGVRRGQTYRVNKTSGLQPKTGDQIMKAKLENKHISHNHCPVLSSFVAIIF